MKFYINITNELEKKTSMQNMENMKGIKEEKKRT